MGMDKKIENKKPGMKQILLIGVGVIVTAAIFYNFLFLDSRSQITVNTDRVFIQEITEDTFQEFIDVSGTFSQSAQPCWMLLKVVWFSRFTVNQAKWLKKAIQ